MKTYKKVDLETWLQTMEQATNWRQLETFLSDCGWKREDVTTETVASFADMWRQLQAGLTERGWKRTVALTPKNVIDAIYGDSADESRATWDALTGLFGLKETPDG